MSLGIILAWVLCGIVVGVIGIFILTISIATMYGVCDWINWKCAELRGEVNRDSIKL